MFAYAGEHDVRHKRHVVGAVLGVLYPVFLGEHADGQAVGAHAFKFVVETVVGVRRADVELAPARYQDVRLLTQAVAELLPRLRGLDVSRHLDVIVLAFVRTGRGDV